MQDETSGMGNGAGAGTGGAVAELKAAGQEAATTARETISELKDQVRERATEGVDNRKHVLADSLSSVVNALRAAERSLREDDQTGLAEYSASIATYMERSSGYVRDNDMSGLMADLQQVGRENTAMFMGSSFAAGAALGRFLRASAPAPAPESADARATPAVPGGVRDTGMVDPGATTTGTRFGTEALS